MHAYMDGSPPALMAAMAARLARGGERRLSVKTLSAVRFGRLFSNAL